MDSRILSFFIPSNSSGQALSGVEGLFFRLFSAFSTFFEKSLLFFNFVINISTATNAPDMDSIQILIDVMLK